MITRRSNASAFVLSLMVHTRSSIAAAVGLLAAVAFSSPVHAETFTLAALDAGADFTVGDLHFDNFVFDSLGSRNVNPLLVNITSTETALPGTTTLLQGFVVSGGMIGDNTTLQFDYTVLALGGEEMSGVVVWLTDFFAPLESGITLLMSEDNDEFSEIGATVNPPFNEFVISSDTIIPFATALEIRGEAILNGGVGGAVAVNSFEHLFLVVPEPGAAALGLAALSTLAMLARTRKSRS